MSARLKRRAGPGAVDVVRFDGAEDAAVTIEVDGAGSYRVITTGTEGGYVESQWKRIDPDTVLDVEISDLNRGLYLIDVPGYVYTQGVDGSTAGRPVARTVLARPAMPSEARRHGVALTVQPPAPSSLCAALLEDA